MLQHRVKLSLITFLAVLLLPVVALAQGPRLYLSTGQLNLQVGEQSTTEVLVEGASSVYGAEFHLSFDPSVLEVVELSHGDFLSADPDNEAFVLQNEFDNEAGTIDYAVSLLNPAPPAEGSGVLLRVTFQGKGEGATQIEFVDSLFGTQTGEELIPTTENVQVAIAPDSGFNATQDQQTGIGARPVEQQTFFRSQDDGGSNGATILGLSLVVGALVLGFFALVLLAILVGVWFWFNRSRQKRRNASAWS